MPQRKGFTLIELLVVISIISILMGILMPALGRVRQQAHAVACRARLKSWGMAFNLYTNEHDGKFNSGWDIGQQGLWMNALRPYYADNAKILRCPTTKAVAYDAKDWGTFKLWSRELELPNGEIQTYTGSYSINSWTNFMTSDRGERKLAWFWRNVNSVRRKDGQLNQIPVFADSTWHDAWPIDKDNPPRNMDEFGSGDQGKEDEMKHFCIDRHQGRVNFTFMDWSVRDVGLKELWILKWHRQFNTHGPWTIAGGIEPRDWPQWMRKYTDY